MNGTDTHKRTRPRTSPRSSTRRRAFARAGAAAALPLAILGAVVAIAAQPPAGSQRTAGTAVSAAGAVTMTNSKAPGAILTAGPMKPGGSTQGTVTITNTGDPATYGLAASHVVDTPGANGGLLSGRLDLLVQDITNATPVTVYSGKLGAMPAAALGSFATGEARTYRFTATLPNGGAAASDVTGDNLYQGSAASIQFDWTATGTNQGGGGNTGGGNTGGGNTGGGNTGTGNTGGGSTSTGSTDTTQPTGTDQGSSTGSNLPTGVQGAQLSLSGAGKQRLGDSVTVLAVCTKACNLTLTGSAKVPGVKKPYALSKVTGDVRAGVRTKIKLKLSKSARSAIKKALARRKRVTVTITGSVKGGKGSTKPLTIRLVK